MFKYVGRCCFQALGLFLEGFSKAPVLLMALLAMSCMISLMLVLKLSDAFWGRSFHTLSIVFIGRWCLGLPTLLFSCVRGIFVPI